MFKLLNKKKNNKGFTLVELVIVVAILAILVGILAPQYTKYVEKSRKSADAANLENLVTAFTTAASDGSDKVGVGTYTITISDANSEITPSGAGATDKDTITALIGTYAGETWTTTTLKSTKWTENADGTGTVLTSISAELEVKNDGSVTVDYTPGWMKNNLSNNNAD